MAITNATTLADYASGIGTQGATLTVDASNKRVGIGTTNPNQMLQVGTAVSVYGNSGIVSATSFFGDGANLTNVGVDTGTLVSDQVFVVGVATVGSAVTINSTGINAISGVITASSFVGNGSLLTDVGITTEFVNADQLTVSGVTTSSSVIVGSAVTINSTGIDAVSGIITATTFKGALTGNVTGNVTGNTSGTAGGLTGSPSINVTNITASGTLTYEDVTNVDSIGIVTARGGLEVGAAGVGGTISSGGNVIFAGITTIGAGLTLADNVRATFGNGGDLQIFHTGSQSHVSDRGGTGDLNLESNNQVNIKQNDASHYMARFNQGGSSEIYYNNSKKFETSTDGTVTTGIATATAIDAGIAIWVLGANGSSHYTFTGPGNLSAADDPQIELQRGQKYVFRNNSGGGHPFQIRVSNGGSAYSTGVTNNGAASGDIEFDVPFDAPNQLYYQCTNHSSMGGVILIGERAIPARDETSQATLTADDAGKVVSTTTGGWIVPTGVLDAGDAVTLINKSGSDQTITCSALTMYNSADGSTVTSRTLGGRGVCTIWFESSSVAYISGAGLS